MVSTRIWSLCVLLVVVCCSHAAAEEEGWRLGEEGGAAGEEGGGSSSSKGKWFVLQDSKHVVKTDAGDMRVVGGFGSKFMTSPMHVGFITMELRTLFIPQSFSSFLSIIYICVCARNTYLGLDQWTIGEARVGHIYKDELVERSLKVGDIYRIEAGSAFYMINRAEGEKLHVICSIDASESLQYWHTVQSFFVAGGTYPASVLSGFDHSTLSAAFNVSEAELGIMLTKQHNGRIIYLSSNDSRSPCLWSKFSEMEHHQKLTHMRRIVHVTGAEDIEHMEEEQPIVAWSIRKLLFSVFGKVDNKKMESKKPHSYNIYDRTGWSTALNGSHYSPLKHEDLGVYLVNLSAVWSINFTYLMNMRLFFHINHGKCTCLIKLQGSMMAPHINPRATEYGIVLRGSGTIQTVHPNGTLAMNAQVTEGDVFWIPRYFPFCQIASRSGPFEFFGFTTSARNNRPQFLAGANSLLHVMRGPEFEAGFGLTEDGLNEILNAQRESIILPAAAEGGPTEEVVGN
ncbi:PREDICTED: vicilin-like antimicrobial peptides 2-2 [Erythranthe guttata]|uniref:vicilin-like antimicrobial peptides 2-2 n=1 Tax=Erythranthe guttata TaxID=4155 RepID=UPI00064DF113|nr:PREDICTED: vicilin-like antimicrobial peptides 2-2 [Erythranthe guttata]|eukprot:XP_012827724.1 PREDICTED: vicilin-like antimicrobial peptides 2-2 [Erythranthe guttata]